jgi:hypothetical protein
VTLPPLPYPVLADGSPDKRKRTADGRILPPRAGMGRPPGVPNKTNQALKEAILLAAERVGDEMADKAAEDGREHPGGLMGYLVMVATTDVKSFCSLLGRVLPLQVTGENGGALEVTFRTVYEPATAAGPGLKLIGSSVAGAAPGAGNDA